MELSDEQKIEKVVSRLDRSKNELFAEIIIKRANGNVIFRYSVVANGVFTWRSPSPEMDLIGDGYRLKGFSFVSNTEKIG